MRKIPWKTLAVIASAIAVQATPVSAWAQTSTTNQNLSGFSLPGVTLPQGHDEVRAADGTSCRSAVSGNGAYMDVGVMGNPDSTVNSTALYGRVVVPLNSPRKRVDCTRLYELEVERLRVELELLKMGMGRDPVSTSSTSGGEQGEEKQSWDDQGWSTKGRKQ